MCIAYSYTYACIVGGAREVKKKKKNQTDDSRDKKKKTRDEKCALHSPRVSQGTRVKITITITPSSSTTRWGDGNELGQDQLRQQRC